MTQISTMTPIGALPANNVLVPLAKVGDQKPYNYDLGADLAARTKSADLADIASAAKGSALVGFSSSLSYTANTVGAFLKSLLASSGASVIGFLQAGTGAVARTTQDKLREIASVKDFGAAVDGSTDDAAAVALAAAAGPFIIPYGNLKTSAVPSVYTALGIGVSFSGTGALDGPYPTFEPGALSLIQKGNGYNCFIGIAHNSMPANTNVQPCAVTGYSRVDNTGNIGFGIFGRADLRATTGVATNEVNSFNYGGNPSLAFPPDRSVGTAQSLPIALTVAAGGAYNSSIGVHIAREGSEPQKFLTGVYFASDAFVNYGVVMDAVAGSTHLPILLKHGVGAIGFQVQGVGTPVAANSAIQYVDGNGVVQWTVKQSGIIHGQGLLSASGANGYEAGAGGAVTQATSKATATTLNKSVGQITLNNAALAANTIVSFTFNNSQIAADDRLAVWVKSGNASIGSYRVAAEGNGSGTRTIVVENKTAGSLSEALVLGFDVYKGAVS